MRLFRGKRVPSMWCQGVPCCPPLPLHHVGRCRMRSCLLERRCERMQTTLPMTFIVRPPPPPVARSFPLSFFSSSSSPLSGSIPICIYNALLRWPRFRWKKLAFHSLRIKPSHSPPCVVVGTISSQATRDGLDFVAPSC